MYFQLGNTFLDSVNGLSESEVAGKNPLEIFSMLGKNVKKVRQLVLFTEFRSELSLSHCNQYIFQTKSEYEALPQESKNSLERHFCVRSSIRIVDEYGILRIAFSVIGIVSDL